VGATAAAGTAAGTAGWEAAAGAGG